MTGKRPAKKTNPNAETNFKKCTDNWATIARKKLDVERYLETSAQISFVKSRCFNKHHNGVATVCRQMAAVVFHLTEALQRRPYCVDALQGMTIF